LSLCPVIPLRLSDGIATRACPSEDLLYVFDSLVAATALEKALTLVTLNRKHYQMIEGLHLEMPITKRRALPQFSCASGYFDAM
jgi:hypothetical protein